MAASTFPVSTDSITYAEEDSISIDEKLLEELMVTTKRAGMIKSNGVMNQTLVTQAELCRAACCNLGESFTTNPSVDVSYSDAATGAKQIKLLGLSGSYVQMLTENIPNFRGAASPFALGYVPGPWMQSIQVSKGSSSVKNGYESITGQINVEYLKPQSEKEIAANLYVNTMAKIEANATANFHLSDKVSTGLLLHYEDGLANHDGNKDGFIDTPDIRQVNAINRWSYFGDRYIFQAGIKFIDEKRESGQSSHMDNESHEPLFRIGLQTDRYEIFAKNAYIFDKEKNTNIALILSGSLHKLDAGYGYKQYKVNQRNLYASLLFETDFSPAHNISTGISFNYDNYHEQARFTHNQNDPLNKMKSAEAVTGAYAQYTFNLEDKLILMGGIRADYSSLFGTFVTPRAHIKYAPFSWGSIRLSVGKGYRTVHPLAENNYLMGSGRTLVIDSKQQEAAWNYGASTSFSIPLFGRNLSLNLEYYYTDFSRQSIIDYDSKPGYILLSDLNGKSYSHTFQVDASYMIFRGFQLTAAYRLSDSKTTYGNQLLERPLTSRYKGLVSAQYSTPLGLWQFDVTMQFNGGGRMPTPMVGDDGTPLWGERFPAYQQLSAQVTRWFRNWSIYLGGENLTGFKQKNPIVAANDPWSTQFDPTMVWGPVEGPMVYLGVRIKF